MLSEQHQSIKYRVPTLLLTKKFQNFSRAFRDPYFLGTCVSQPRTVLSVSEPSITQHTIARHYHGQDNDLFTMLHMHY